MSDMTREEAKEFFEDPYVNYETHGYYTEEEEIEANNWAISALSADVRPNIHGHWIDEKVGRWFAGDIFKCSECGNTLNISGVNRGRGDANFCPNCGADMRPEPYKKGE